MTGTDDQAAARHEQAQRELYGEPLGPLLRGIGRRLGLTQGRIATVLGISAPMLSQLMSAQRIKVGNPAAAARLQDLIALDQAAPGLTAAEIEGRLGEIASTTDWVTSTAQRVQVPVLGGGAEPWRVVQDLFREVAAAGDYLAAADMLADAYPGIAQLLRMYGAGRSDEVRAHYQAYRG